MADEPSIARPATVEQFLKTTTRLRVGPEPIKLFIGHLDALARAVAKQAAELAHADGDRHTLVERDIEEAFKTAGGAASTSADPAVIFSLIDHLPTEQVATLITQIEDWLKARP